MAKRYAEKDALIKRINRKLAAKQQKVRITPNGDTLLFDALDNTSTYVPSLVNLAVSVDARVNPVAAEPATV